MSFVHLNIDKMGKKSKRKCVVLLSSPAAQFIVFHGIWDFNIEVTDCILLSWSIKAVLYQGISPQPNLCEHQENINNLSRTAYPEIAIQKLAEISLSSFKRLRITTVYLCIGRFPKSPNTLLQRIVS